MNDIQIECARHSIKAMMDKGWLDITTVDQVLKITGGVPLKHDYDALRLLHCVHFKDMSQALRMAFPNLLQRVLESPSMEVNITFKAVSRMPELITN